MSAYRYAKKTIFILGAPRSGTTWIAKTFDAHPDVLYRHEPDISERNLKLPFICDDGDVQAFRDEAAEWLNVLAANCSLKSVGTFPIFPKAFNKAPQRAVRKILIYGLKLLQAAPRCRNVANAINLPDFVDLEAGPYRKLVIKSVSGMGRAGLFAAASPESRIIVIMRHPCGQVESMLRGVRGSMFEHVIPIKVLADTAQARRLNLSQDSLMQESLAAQLAWNWVIINEMAMDALSQARHVHLVKYDQIAKDPQGAMRSLFAFCDLDWTRTVEDFVDKSTRVGGRKGYYQIKRNPIEASQGWLNRLSEIEIQDIMRIATRSQWGRMFLEPS